MSATATRKPTLKRTTKPRLAKPGEAASTPTARVTAADPVTALLDSYKFDYELVTLHLKDIDKDESRRNQARIAEPVNDDVVLSYAEFMKAGDKFPPIVVYKSGSTYIVMDGNHRVAAALLGDETDIQAYVVKNPSPAEVKSFTFASNTKHGLPTALTDRLRQAIALVEQHEVKAVDAAQQLGIPLSRLRTELDNHQTNSRFRELGIKRFEVLPLAVRRRLNSIHSNRVLTAAAELALDAGLSADETNKFVRRVNTKRSEREALETIKAERESRLAVIKSTAGGRIPVPQVLVTLARFTSGVANIEDKAVRAAADTLSAEARTEYARSAQEAGARLIQMAGLIGRPEA